MSTRFFQQTITVLASTGDTNRVLGAVEVASPSGAAPPLHVHHRENEAFYVLEGEYTVFVGDDVISGVPGTWVWGPRAVPHGYQVHSRRGRHLSLTMPGGLRGLLRGGRRPRHTVHRSGNVMGQLTAVAARYGVELLGPPRSQT